MNVARTWGSTGEERARAYACDALLPDGDPLFRAVDVAAPAGVTFRRLCMLRVAPYSYDWLDNAGRRSPRAIADGIEHLEAGQRVMTIFSVASFVPGSEVTLRVDPPMARRFGDVAITYAVIPSGVGACRIVAKLRWQRAAGSWGALRAELLAWGDLIMMRKQLLTLARLAERDLRRAA